MSAAWLRKPFYVRRPAGLVSLSYLWPPAFSDPLVRQHCRMWRAGRGRLSWPLWIAREAWGWLLWTFWFGWRSALAAVSARGSIVETNEGISLRQQRLVALRLAIGWGIPGYEIYRFRLYRAPRRALEYVYDCETGAFHTRQSASEQASSAANDLLRDKVVAAALLKDAGITVVPTVALVPRYAKTALGDMLVGGPIFCKTRSGHGGHGAFAAWPYAGGAAGRLFAGRVLTNAAAVDAAWRDLLKRDDALVQPLLNDHDDLARLSKDGPLTTVRYVTRHQGSDSSCLYAVLEIPAQLEGSQRARHAIVPVDPADGALLPLPGDVDADWLATVDVVRARAPEVTHVPHWAVIAAGSITAHRAVGGAWAIAWDWAVTPSGPVLLEGNVGWGLGILQQLHGPILGRERPGGE